MTSVASPVSERQWLRRIWVIVSARVRRWSLVAVVLGLVVSAGAVALVGADHATSDQEAVHRADRLALSKSLSTLAAGYFLQLQVAQSNVANALPATVSSKVLSDAIRTLPGSPTVALIEHRSTSTVVGAYREAMSANLVALVGDLGDRTSISQVEQLAGHPVVLIAVDASPATSGRRLVVAYDLDALPIAAYVQQLQIGDEAVAYLVDANGRLVTSPDVKQVGEPAPSAVGPALTGAGDKVIQTAGPRPDVVAVTAVAMGGWHLVIVQPAPLFYGALWHAGTTMRWVLLAFLIVVASALLWSHSKRQAALHAIAAMALKDSLTGLPNRVAFTRALAKAMDRHRRDHSEVALLFCDLDGFKAVNDQLGHDAGDLLLEASAQRLAAVAGSASGVTTSAARLGGDEFTILLEGKRVNEQAGVIAQALTAAIGEPFILKGQRVQVGISVGIAYAQPDRDLLKDADVAMYRTKAVRKAALEAGEPDRFSTEPHDRPRAV